MAGENGEYSPGKKKKKRIHNILQCKLILEHCGDRYSKFLGHFNSYTASTPLSLTYDQ